MHMLPPQAPPAIEQTTHQEATDTVSRLVDTQQWLIERQALIPDPQAWPDAGSLDPYLAALAAFWSADDTSAPGMAPVPRSAALAQRLATTMKDEATLRGLDGTLEARAKDLAIRFAQSSGALPPGVHARELMFGNTSYAGAVIVVDDATPDLVLLFHPMRGWDAFASLDALHRDAEARVRFDLARGRLPSGMAPADMERVLDHPFAGSRVIDGDVFHALAGRIAELQRDLVAEAWQGVSAAPDREAVTRYLTDIVAPLTSLHHYLDIATLMTTRQARLRGALVEERLAPMPAAVQSGWRAAAATLTVEMRTTASERSENALAEPDTLDRFVSKALASRLVALGITENPDDITVDVFPMPNLDTPAQAYDAWMNGVQPPPGSPIESMTLADLALRNVGFLDRQTFRARGKAGQNLAPLLNHQAIKRLVREADIGSRYRQHLTATLQSSPEGRLTRALATRVMQARMGFEAADARLSYYAPNEPSSFMEDRDERGYQWVKAVIDAPTPGLRRRIDGHEVVVRQLIYKGIPVKDVLLVGVRGERSVPRVVLYTPGAPDNRTFREFPDRRSLALEVLYNRAFETYLLDRLPTDVATTASNGVRHFRLADTDRRAHWSLAAGNSDFVRTDEPFQDRIVEGNFLDVAYDTGVSLMTRNLQGVARPTQHADVDNVSPRIDGEAMARGIAHLIGRPAMASWRAYDAIRAGDPAQAFVDLTDAYVSSLDYLGMGAMKPLLTRSIGVRAAAHSQRIAASGKTLRDPATIFEPRFAVRDVAISARTPGNNGIYTVDGLSYIRQGGQVYGVSFDTATGSWRLTRPHPVDATFTGPAIAHHPDGLWRYQAVGLRGGDPNGYVPYPQRVGFAFDLPDHGGMTLNQRRVTAQTLMARTNRTRAWEIMREVMNPLPHHVPRLSPAERALWIDALLEGRRAPRDTPVIVHRVAAAPMAPVRPAAPARALAPAPILSEVPVAEWPDALWHYPSLRHPRPEVGAGRLILPMSRQNAAGAVGFPAVSLAPDTPWPTLNAALGGPTLVPGAPALSFEWVRIDLARVRARVGAGGRPGFQLYRVQNGTETNFLLRRTGDAGDLHLAWLDEGEFETGRRFVIDPPPAAVAGPSWWRPWQP